MSRETLQQLQTALHDWEAQYMDLRQDLQPHELDLLWLRLFRLSRQMIRDHNTLLHHKTLADETIAYTGEAKRLSL